jgi:hypothetical protein
VANLIGYIKKNSSETSIVQLLIGSGGSKIPPLDLDGEARKPEQN